MQARLRRGSTKDLLCFLRDDAQSRCLCLCLSDGKWSRVLKRITIPKKSHPLSGWLFLFDDKLLSSLFLSNFDNR